MPFSENEEDLAKQSDHLDDGDLEYINSILNSFSSPTCYRQGSSQLKLKSITPEDAPARSWTSQMTPPKFNLNFNQNSTTHSPGEDHFSHFSSVKDKGDIELGDYFSDDEEDDTEISQNSKSESNFWSPTKFKNSEEKFPLSQTAFSEWNPVISSLKTFEEEKEGAEINHISGFLEANQLIKLFSLELIS
jgi:hypothetical protein